MTIVRLVSYSKPTLEFVNEGISNDDVLDLVAYCARVSNPSNQMNTETSEKLIKYLIKHQHWSPLEMASACLEINTTRDIAHHIVRHRSFSFQEFSQRYADPTKDLEFEVREARMQDPKNRQNSIPTDDYELDSKWHELQKDIIRQTRYAYTWAIEHGIAKEQARAVLPEGNTESVLYMAGSLRSWIHYCQLRRGHGTQKEHMIVADKCWDIINTHFPAVVEAVDETSMAWG